MAEQVSTTEDINDLYDSLTGTQKCAIFDDVAWRR